MNDEEFSVAAKDDAGLSGLLTGIADDVRGGSAPKTYLEVAPVEPRHRDRAGILELAPIGAREDAMDAVHDHPPLLVGRLRLDGWHFPVLDQLRSPRE